MKTVFFKVKINHTILPVYVKYRSFKAFHKMMDRIHRDKLRQKAKEIGLPIHEYKEDMIRRFWESDIALRLRAGI